jgi:hypothetical protein
MPAPLDLTGLLFGRLTALTIDKEKTSRTRKRHWHCDCACGGKALVWSVYLRSGHTTSCGCARSEAARKVGRASRERTRAAREALEGERRSGPGGLYMPRAEAMRRLRASRSGVEQWQESCVHLGGRGMRTIPVPGAAGLETWCHVGDVERIEQARHRPAPGRYPYEDGDYVTLALLKREHRINADRVYSLKEAGVVKSRPHPDDRREGEDGKQPRVYHEGQAIAAEERRLEGFTGEFRTPGGVRWNLTRAAEESGLPRGLLEAHIRRSPHFPEGGLPSVPMRPPAEFGSRNAEHTVLPADARRLAAAIRAALDEGETYRQWPEAKDIPNRWRLSREQRWYLPAMLREWEEKGLLPARRVWREQKRDRRVYRWRVWKYDPVALGRLFKGEAGAAEPSLSPADPPNSTTEAPPPAAFPTPFLAGKKRRPGRPSASEDERMQKRNKALVQDYLAGKYPTMGLLAKAHHISRTRASHILTSAGISR